MPIPKPSCDWCDEKDEVIHKDYGRNKRAITCLCEWCLTDLIEQDLDRAEQDQKIITKLEDTIKKLRTKIKKM